MFIPLIPSLKEALARVASLRRIGVLQPISIRIAPGVYEMDAPLCIDETVSSVTLEPDGEGEVLLSGGRRITGWKEDIFNGAACLSAHIPEVQDGKWNFTDLYTQQRKKSDHL